jgi:hypothetical protein
MSILQAQSLSSNPSPTTNKKETQALEVCVTHWKGACFLSHLLTLSI